MKQLGAYFEKRLTQFDLPIAADGGGLAKDVWDIMLAIPYGETLTYGDVATRLAQELITRDKVDILAGFTLSPNAIPVSKVSAEAKKFIEWATSKNYIQMIGEKEGWVTAPPGTRKSTYANAAYMAAAPFAPATLSSIEFEDPVHTTQHEKPYLGVNFAAVPEYQGIGTFTAQQVAAALTGKMSIDDALAAAAANSDKVMKKAGYIK